MGADTKIERCHHTFNPVIGCTAVSPACDGCYAEAWVNGRMGGDFSQRRVTSDENWSKPLRWNRAAAAEGRRDRVFCASLADVFDNKWPEGVRERLWRLIYSTPHLDWLLLTKRPQNIRKMLPAPEEWARIRRRVWAGITAENQTELDRRAPALFEAFGWDWPAVFFASCEPLLGPLNLQPWLHPVIASCPSGFCRHGQRCEHEGDLRRGCEGVVRPAFDWIIGGGETGKGARPVHPRWADDLALQCDRARVPFLWKQWGDWAPTHPAWPGPEAMRVGKAMATDGTLYDPPDLAYPDGARYGEAVRADHAGKLAMVYRGGKAKTGRLLNGILHDAYPEPRR